jgi:hypothetical protein
LEEKQDSSPLTHASKSNLSRHIIFVLTRIVTSNLNIVMLRQILHSVASSMPLRKIYKKPCPRSS